MDERDYLILEQKELLHILKDRIFTLHREIDLKDSHIRVLENQNSEYRLELQEAQSHN